MVLSPPFSGSIVIDRQSASHGPADAVAPIHSVRAEAVCQQVQEGDPQQDHRGHHVHHGIQAVARAPHGGVQYEQNGKQHVGRHHTLQIPGAGGDDRRVRGEDPGQRDGQPHHKGGTENCPHNGHGHGDFDALTDPVLPACPHILPHKGDHSGGQALDRQKGQGIQFIAHVEASSEGLSVAVDLGEYAHGAQGHQRHLDTAGQANADDLTEQFAVEDPVEGMNGQLRISAVDIPDAEQPAA